MNITKIYASLRQLVLQHKVDLCILLLVTVMALVWRGPAFTASDSLWVDEFSTASQAKLVADYGVEAFFQDEWLLETRTLVYSVLTATSTFFLGWNEYALVLPALLAGVIIPGLCYLVLRSHGISRISASVVAILIVVSHPFLVWSTQARGYTLQTILILFLMTGLRPFSQLKWWHKIALFGVMILGYFTHLLLLFPSGALVLFWLLHWFISLSVRQKSVVFTLGVLCAGAILWVALEKIPLVGLVDNSWYYLQFYVHELHILTILGGVGLLIGLIRHRFISMFAVFNILVLAMVIFFLLGPYTVRYGLQIVLYMLIGVGMLIGELAERSPVDSRFKFLIGMLATVGLVVIHPLLHAMPQNHYSVNFPMREIARVPYDQVYQPITAAIAANPDQKIALVDTWWSRSWWYLGKGYQPLFGLRWDVREGSINGLDRLTPYVTDETQFKRIEGTGPSSIGLVMSLEDFEQVIQEYQCGFMYIDDTSLSSEIQQYAQDNLDEVITVSTLPADNAQNELSVWPGTLYSWGMEGDTCAGR